MSLLKGAQNPIRRLQVIRLTPMKSMENPEKQKLLNLYMFIHKLGVLVQVLFTSDFIFYDHFETNLLRRC